MRKINDIECYILQKGNSPCERLKHIEYQPPSPVDLKRKMRNIRRIILTIQWRSQDFISEGKHFKGSVSCGDAEEISKIWKIFVKKSAKMHYFNQFFKKFKIPCVNLSRVWTKNTNCWENFENFWWTFNRKIDFLTNFGKDVAKNISLGNDVIFLQKIFPFREGGRSRGSPLARPLLLLAFKLRPRTKPFAKHRILSLHGMEELKARIKLKLQAGLNNFPKYKCLFSKGLFSQEQTQSEAKLWWRTDEIFALGQGGGRSPKGVFEV